MGILLAFAPFFVFAVVNRLWGSTLGLTCGAATSAALMIRDWMGSHRNPKILEVGTFLLFGGLAIYTVLSGVTGSIMGVRLRVDAGLLAIVLVTTALRRPFTLQYAREQVPKDLWHNPTFIRANYIPTAVWAATFAVVVAADMLLLFRADLPSWIGIAATILALTGAFKFTKWYPERHVPPAMKP
jgi:hypothetical protein